MRNVDTCSLQGTVTMTARRSEAHQTVQTCRWLTICCYFLRNVQISWSFPAAARFKAWVCGRYLAGIVGSNPTGGMDECLC